MLYQERDSKNTGRLWLAKPRLSIFLIVFLFQFFQTWFPVVNADVDGLQVLGWQRLVPHKLGPNRHRHALDLRRGKVGESKGYFGHFYKSLNFGCRWCLGKKSWQFLENFSWSLFNSGLYSEVILVLSGIGTDWELPMFSWYRYAVPFRQYRYRNPLLPMVL